MRRIYPALSPLEGSAVRLLQVVDGNQEKENTNGGTTTAKEGLASIETDPEQIVPPRKEHYRVTMSQIAKGFPILHIDDRNPLAAEQYRALRTNILHKAPNCSVLAITSAGPGDGKTVTSFNLAAVLALKSETRILVIDGDMRKRGLSTALGLEARIGLAEVLKQTHDLDSALAQLDDLKNLYVLPAGMPSAHPAELLDSPALAKLVTELRKRFLYVIFDTIPGPFLTDFKLIQRVSDGVIMVVRPDHTGRTAFLKALESNEIERLLGTVLNGVEDWFLWKSGGGYEYLSYSAGKKKS